MSNSTPSSARAARVNADEAKRRLDATLAQLKTRLDPAALRQDANHFAREQARAIARQSRQQISRRPAAVIAIGGALAALLLQRPIRSFIARRREARARRPLTGVTIEPPRPGGNDRKGTSR